MMRLGTQLDQGIHGHAVQAGAESQQGQVGHDSPMVVITKEGRDIGKGRTTDMAHALGRQVEVKSKDRHAHRTHGHQADLDMAVRQGLAGQRACGNAH